MFRCLIVGFLLLWLPFQGIAAVTMPFCTHALAGSPDAVEIAGAGDHAHHQGRDSAHHQPSQAHEGLACNDCGACNLACAPVVPVTGSVTLDLLPAGFVSHYVVSLQLFDPELPLPPPLA